MAVPAGRPRGLEPEGERSLALVMHAWGHPSTFYAWQFMKQYILRRMEWDGQATLDPREKLYIVKAGKPDDTAPDRWKVGGPLVPDLDTALQHYPHTLVKLEGSVKSNILTFLAQHHIDILVIPDAWPTPVLSQLPGFTTVTEWVKQNAHCAFILTRRDAVVNARMKFSSHLPSGSPPSLAASGPLDSLLDRGGGAVYPHTAASSGRRVAIAYGSFPVGRGLMQFAKDRVLTHNDTIYICHCFPNPNPVVKDALKFMRAMTLQRPDSREVTRDNSIEFGAAELAGYDLNLNVMLQGDSKSAISAFCESEHIELLIIGSRGEGKMRKRLGGGSVSSYLIDHAPCPCLVVPYKAMGLEDGGTAEEELASSPTSSLAAGGAAGGAAAAVASMQRAEAAAAAAAAQAETRGEAREQAEGSAAPAHAGGVADTLAAAAAPGGGGHSTPSDLLAALQRQIEDKDQTIAELRRQVQELQRAAEVQHSLEIRDAAHADHAV